MRYRKTNPLNRGFKEKVIVDDLNNFLQSEHVITIITNKRIDGGSSLRRPDVLINCHDYSIIVEIDERQHRSYSTYSKEKNEQRMNDLISDLPGRKIVIIRFNPDSYKDANRVVRKSLFSKTKKERIYQIGCPKKYEERMTVLKDLVVHYLSHAPEKALTEHKLYYDKFDVEQITLNNVETGLLIQQLKQLKNAESQPGRIVHVETTSDLYDFM